MTKSILSASVAAFLNMQAMADGVEGDAAAASPAVMNGKEFKYNFKSPPDVVVKDEEGKEISRSKGVAHPAVKVVLPVPSAADVVDVLQYVGQTEQVGDKQVPTLAAKKAALVLEAVHELIFLQGRSQINEFLDKNSEVKDARFTATMFDLDRLSLDYIASLDAKQRGAWAPSDQDLEVFCTDYTNVFVHEVQYDPKKVKVHCDQFKKGFIKIKADKIALGKMQEFLTIWASKASEDSAAENEQTYNWLSARLDRYVKAEEKNYADAL